MHFTESCGLTTDRQKRNAHDQNEYTVQIFALPLVRCNPIMYGKLKAVKYPRKIFVRSDEVSDISPKSFHVQ